jgi:hypothetical protein
LWAKAVFVKATKAASGGSDERHLHLVPMVSTVLISV